MSTTPDPDLIAEALRADVARSASGAKRLKLRTLLAKFGYVKRSDANTAEITRALNSVGLALNPPVVRFGETWDLATEDWIYLSSQERPTAQVTAPPIGWSPDAWFDRLPTLTLRTEREVESKFVVPLLTRLGYHEDDRFDGMPVPTNHGSRSVKLVIDFALFNSELESLRNQPLLTVEAKRDNSFATERDLASAHGQAKSYCFWTQCDHFMITDSRTVQAFHTARGRVGELAPLFKCERSELKVRFGELYSRFSKEALTQYYLNRLATTEEAV